MAACGFGASGFKVTNLDLGSVRPKLSTWQPLQGLRAQKIVQFDGLVLSQRSKKGIFECRNSNSEADSNANLEDAYVENVSSDAQSTLIPSSYEVESLLTVLCDTTSIAEFDLKLGGFQLHVKRDLAVQNAPPQPPSPDPVIAHSVAETPGSNGSASSPSLALVKSVPSSHGIQPFLDKAADEGLVILTSPGVGYFRRSRNIKGDWLPPACTENDIVKEGKVLCFIEQLGGQVPVQTNVAGEIVKILKEEGDPVGYGDALMAVLPSFPGIKNLH
ncbi:hypothetical protein CDL12_17274 [Handroanthus impetiginosus]|uniref:Lipoyl-binding domain-containing protein n=1 Tax=Handroanthus impetiginosus TaxID=429701 RepID=A0A2G9GXY3_9LAMI|nr:hypothetical protein CDL12_17274 [Handroanthus impetiginosus]